MMLRPKQEEIYMSNPRAMHINSNVISTLGAVEEVTLEMSKEAA